jgi:hypothetical protein
VSQSSSGLSSLNVLTTMNFCHIDKFSVKLGIRSGKERFTHPSSSSARRTKWLIPIGLCSLFFLCTVLRGGNFSSHSFSRSAQSVQSDIQLSKVSRAASTHSRKALDENLQTAPPAIAYLIMASKHSTEQVQRLLLAVYHPHNQYLLHLDAEAPAHEHQDLADFVKNETMFQECRNVQVISDKAVLSGFSFDMTTLLFGMWAFFFGRQIR